jgi:formylmethanofuran dehydrogenase subunit D
MAAANSGSVGRGKTWTAEVFDDPDDPEQGILQFPDELVEQLGWKEGDTLVWSVQDDGSVVIKKADK